MADIIELCNKGEKILLNLDTVSLFVKKGKGTMILYLGDRDCLPLDISYTKIKIAINKRKEGKNLK